MRFKTFLSNLFKKIKGKDVKVKRSNVSSSVSFNCLNFPTTNVGNADVTIFPS